MARAQIYCTLQEVIDDLGLSGDERGLFDRIKQASDQVERMFGAFIPETETRYFQGDGSQVLEVPPLLAVTTLTVDGDAITAYALRNPNNATRPLWTNGPYLRIKYLDGIWSTDDDFDGGYGNAVSGRWGLYEATEDLGITGTQASTSTTDLTVADGSKLCPGMVLLIGSEQELVSALGAGSTLTSLVNGAIDEEDEEIAIDNGAEVKIGETIQIDVEDLFIRKINGNTLAVERGWNSTKRASHADNAAIKVYRTFTVVRGVNGTTAATHSSAAISRYLAPANVNWLTRQIAGLMRGKAKSGFAGKSGGGELGETYYYNEFPRQIADIQRNFRVYG